MSTFMYTHIHRWATLNLIPRLGLTLHLYFIPTLVSKQNKTLGQKKTRTKHHLTPLEENIESPKFKQNYLCNCAKYLKFEMLR